MDPQTSKLLHEILDAHLQAVDRALPLTNEDLDRRLPAFGSREAPLRNLLYQLGAHPREHAVHIAKMLQETGAPGARPTEAQLIMGTVWQSLAELMAVAYRLRDADLQRTLEGQTIAEVLEHVVETYRNYSNRVAAGAGR